MGRWSPTEVARYLKLELGHGLVGKRWSLRELASNSVVSSPTSLDLLQSTVQRLAFQHHTLEEWLTFTNESRSETIDSQTQGSLTSLTKVLKQRLETLRYIHFDTFQLGRQLLENKTLWERFSSADKHVVNATFLEVRARHANTVEAVVDVVTHIRQYVPATAMSSTNGVDWRSRHEYLANAFLQRRLGVQLLCDHHVEMYKGKKPTGGISVDAPMSLSVTDAVLEAQHIVDVHLQIFPETRYDPPLTDLVTCCFVQPWVHHALVELLKNAMASAVLQMKEDNLRTPSPLVIQVRNEDSAIVLDIVDQGTGVLDIPRAFALGHSSAGRKWDRLEAQTSYATVRSPLSSLGVGLPVSRYMMEHFGGSLTLNNNNNAAVSNERGCTASIRFPIDDTLLERMPGN